MSTVYQDVSRQKQFVAGGTMSINRAITPDRVFVKAKGAHLWDSEGKRYIDYHAGFAPYLFGHADTEIDEAVITAIRSGHSLVGAGTAPWEAELAEMLAGAVPSIEQVQLTSTGSEAVSYALRLARAHTGRDTIIVMQGGYNGWADYVSYNLMDPVEVVASHQPGEEYPLRVTTAGIPSVIAETVKVIEYNDLAAAERLIATGTIAGIILEPVLQNIGIVKPEPGYLEGLRALCDRYGTVLIFDEVKTGFRHALGGYQSICGVMPDLCTFGKAVANGYPLGVVGGKRQIMQLCGSTEPGKRVVVAGTYNGHPVNVAAARATLLRLKSQEVQVYSKLESLGARMQVGLERIFAGKPYATKVARQGSAFTVYFMDHLPKDWRDIALHNDAARDVTYRRAMIEAGVFHFPITTKQSSISLAHSDEIIDETLEITAGVVAAL